MQYLYEHPDESGHDELVLKDGRIIDRLTSPFKTADGEYLGRIWFFRDITERRKSEEALRASEERFRLLVEGAPDAILLYDFDQERLIAVNQATERLFGASRDEILKDGLPALLRAGAARRVAFGASFSEKGARALAGEEVVLRATGSPAGSAKSGCAAPRSSGFRRTSACFGPVSSTLPRRIGPSGNWRRPPRFSPPSMKSSPDGILIVSVKGRIISVNRRFGEIFKIPQDLLEARDDEPVLALASQQVFDAEAFERRVRRLYAHPDESAHDEVVLKDGRVLDRFTSAFKTPDGEYLGRVWFFRDITERRKAEEALRASEERFRLLVEEAPDAILLYDFERDHVVGANKAAERLLGVSRNEILGRGPRRFFAPEELDGPPVAQIFWEHNRRALAGEEVTIERRFRRPSGEERICRGALVRLPSNLRLLRASFIDITEQRAAEAQLSEVLRGTLLLQEAERQRIARELHDSLSQYLAALSMRLEMFGRNTPKGSPLTSAIAELKGLTRAVGDEVSRLAWELRPIALDDIGLEPAIQRFIDEWRQRSGLRFDLLFDLKSRRLSSIIETTLYRVLQEAVTNIVKHASATKVGVVLETTRDAVAMIIEDDGKGFDPETVNRGASPRLGLLGMRERLVLIHGSLEIESKPGSGTTLIIRAPLNSV